MTYIEQLISGGYKSISTNKGCVWFSQVTDDLLEPGNAVSKGQQGYLFSENLFKAPKRKYCNDAVFAAIRQEPASSIVRCIPKHIAKEPRGNKRFLLSGFPGANSFLFCSILVGTSGLRQNEIKSTAISNSVGLAAAALCRIPSQNPKV